jgi:hypothetical protein
MYELTFAEKYLDISFSRAVPYGLSNEEKVAELLALRGGLEDFKRDTLNAVINFFEVENASDTSHANKNCIERDLSQAKSICK